MIFILLFFWTEQKQVDDASNFKYEFRRRSLSICGHYPETPETWDVGLDYEKFFISRVYPYYRLNQDRDFSVVGCVVGFRFGVYVMNDRKLESV